MCGVNSESEFSSIFCLCVMSTVVYKGSYMVYGLCVFGRVVGHSVCGFGCVRPGRHWEMRVYDAVHAECN